MAENKDNLDVYEDDNDVITLTLEDGSEIDCDVLAVFPVGDNDYIALLPQNDESDGEVYLYRFVQNGDEDIELINIEDDEEFEAVSDAFDELLDDEELNDMLEEEGYTEDEE
ncbi:MAG: DUF1292 domain-containing protein [Lachnospiraceae bacterium]|nr:DUF1292 domain-containing protein [Lachnospiraceae bacterium]